jgi:hypothetical protein
VDNVIKVKRNAWHRKIFTLNHMLQSLTELLSMGAIREAGVSRRLSSFEYWETVILTPIVAITALILTAAWAAFFYLGGILGWKLVVKIAENWQDALLAVGGCVVAIPVSLALSWFYDRVIKDSDFATVEFEQT